SVDIIELYIKCVKLVLILNLGLNIYHLNMNLSNFIISEKGVKIIDFGRAEYESNPEGLSRALKNEIPQQPDVNELLNKNQDCMFLIDIPRLTNNFIRVAENVDKIFAEKLKKSRLNEITTIFNIYKKLYLQGKFDYTLVLLEIYKLVG